MKKIVMYFYNKGNLGDDLFVNIINERYSNRLEFFSKKRASYSYPKDILNHKNGVIWLLLKIVSMIFNNNFELIYLLKRNDLLLYIGGSIFIENNESNNLSKWNREKIFYSKLKKPYYILGANFGPYIHEDFIKITESILSAAKDVCFRDSYSYNQFKHLDSVRYSSDIVLSMNPNKYKMPHQKKVLISVIDSYMNFDNSTASKYEEDIIKLSKKFIKKGYMIEYMSFCKYENDEKAIKRIVEKIDIHESNFVSTYNYRGNIKEALGKISECEIVVGTRFHSIILGMLFGKKILPIIYSNKTINFLKDINYIGPKYDIRDLNFDCESIELSEIKTHNISKQAIESKKQFNKLDLILERRE